MPGPRHLTILAWLAATSVGFFLATGSGRLFRTSTATFQDPRGRTEVCVLIADPTNKFTRVPPPPAFAWPSLRPFGAAAAAITVTYVGFPPAAQAAFQYAVEIWQSQITSPVPIFVRAEYVSLDPGVLGTAGPTYYLRDFAGGMPGTWYHSALADKLAATDLNPGFTDITARFNSDFTWYFGTDGFTPAGQYDFVSVVLHELGHGLGFTGSATVSSGLGGWGLSGDPVIYDRFVVNGAGTQVIDTAVFPNPSSALAAELTSNNLYWGGANAVAAAGGVPPKLYAPTTWRPGSSYSHLDEATYPAGSPNSLMTYALGAAEAIHDPGPITRGMFADEGWTTVACAYNVSPTSVSVGSSGGTGSVAVSTQPGCTWTATSGVSWMTITAGASGTGSGTVTYSVAANTGRPRTGTLTVAGQVVTVSQASPLPTLSASPTTLRFGAVNSGGTLTARTEAQEVTLAQSGSGVVTWSAEPDVPWIQVSGGTGTGSGRFTVDVTNTGGALPPSGIVTGTVRVTANGAQADLTVTVILTVYAPGTTSPPFGWMDTPLEGASGVTGSLPVTGWALDDVGVTRVRIWRDAVPPEPAGAQIFIGDAVFVAGARPDVAAAYPGYPRAHRGGWGYLLLTNMLPNLGNGTFTLRAYAEDAEGRVVPLGSRTVTCTNATATEPFGTIDTPAQGASVSGSTYVNFGWVLTPRPKVIPPDGSTILVWIDGRPVGSVTYNNYRSDIATLFPGYANSGGAVGYRYLDTTTVTNGMHTIEWSVRDDSGAAAGIGSRYFTVLNTPGLSTPGVETSGDSADAGVSRSEAAGVAAMTAGVASGPLVLARTGHDLETPVRVVPPDFLGRRWLRVKELDRVELHFAAPGGEGAMYRGDAGGGAGHRALPVGSHLSETGVFTWQLGAGFVGTYDLMFERVERGTRTAAIPIRILVSPKHPDTGRLRLVVDAPQPGSVSTPFVLGGWAFDGAAPTGTGVDAIHVWAYPEPGSGRPPVFVGAAPYGGMRPDVGAVFGERFTSSGFTMVVDRLPPGEYDLAVFPYRAVTRDFGPAQTVRVRVH